MQKIKASTMDPKKVAYIFCSWPTDAQSYYLYSAL